MFLFTCTMIHIFMGTSIADTIKPLSSEKHILEGTNVILSCNYSVTTGTSADSLQWYRQYLGATPQFLLSVTEYANNSEPALRLFSKATKDIKRVDLEISSAATSDSALYYCALTSSGLGQIYFGSGTKLIVETKKEVKPSIYKVGDSCLATDFTNHDAVNKTEPFSSKTAVRYEGQNYYSSFSIDGECQEQGSCSSSSSSSSDQSSEIEKDEKINFLSVGIFWLRILFLKTVVFNVLVTFKAWMS